MCPIYTDKRTGNLFVQFDYKRQTFKQHLPPGATRLQAQKLETKLRSDAFFQSHGMAPRDEVLFEDFVQETYLPYAQANTPASYFNAENICIAAAPFLKGKFLRSIKPADIDRFKTFRMACPTIHGRKRKPATVWREISILSRLFSLAIRDGVCDINPCTRIEKPKYDNIQTRTLAREDEHRFLGAFDVEQGRVARDICILVLNTGLRQNDVLGLTDFSILSTGAIRLVQGKTGRAVEIPLNPTAAAIVARYKGRGLLFPSPKTGKPMHYIRKAIAGACRRAEIDPITIRDLRRTFATRLADDGVDALTIAMLLGHSDMRMVHRYARSSNAMLNAVNRLENTTKPAPILPGQTLRIAK